MSTNEKVYVIRPVKKSERQSIGSVIYSPSDSAGQDGTAQSAAARARAELDRLEAQGSPARAFLAYLAGPLSILATRHGRRSGFWTVVAYLSWAAAAVFFLRALGAIPSSPAFGVGSLMWTLGACVATIVGCIAWARGVLLVGLYKNALLRRLPTSLRHPGVVGILGLIVPGFGLHVIGRPLRAVCAILSAALVIISAIVLLNAPGLWHHSMEGGILSLPPDDLEIVFVAMAAIGLFGALAWIVQALDGMRLASLRPDGATQPRGDLAAIALVVAIALFAGLFQPAETARAVDRFAVSMQWEGMRLIPLEAASLAMRLDPSRPEYVLHVIAMNESLDRLAEADALRDDLAVRWDAYARTLPMVP